VIGEMLRLALARLGTGRLRAALTMLGIAIGVASVVALVGIVQGATSSITAQLQGLGTNLISVSPGRLTFGATRGALGSVMSLTIDDAAAIAGLDGVAAVAPELGSQQLLIFGDKNETTSVVGTTSSFAEVRSWPLWGGAFFSDFAVDRALRVAVLGTTAADTLGIGPSEIGSQITIGGLPFEVVGILQPKGGSGVFNQDDQVLIPISTARDLLVGSKYVRTINVSATSPADVALAESAITLTLRQRHGTTPGNDDFSIFDQGQLLDILGTITGLLTTLLAGIASISLLVGGVGIMNIMLVSVRERTREIGIRKAVGAQNRDILLQFLIEALTLSVLGGMVGLVVGVLASAAIGAYGGWGLVLSPVVPVVAIGFSLAVGVLFGVWPARQAARLDPIEALRYE
jgi:putative ABC transport system permease protein